MEGRRADGYLIIWNFWTKNWKLKKVNINWNLFHFIIEIFDKKTYGSLPVIISGASFLLDAHFRLTHIPVEQIEQNSFLTGCPQETSFILQDHICCRKSCFSKESDQKVSFFFENKKNEILFWFKNFQFCWQTFFVKKFYFRNFTTKR